MRQSSAEFVGAVSQTRHSQLWGITSWHIRQDSCRYETWRNEIQFLMRIRYYCCLISSFRECCGVRVRGCCGVRYESRIMSHNWMCRKESCLTTECVELYIQVTNSIYKSRTLYITHKIYIWVTPHVSQPNASNSKVELSEWRVLWCETRHIQSRTLYIRHELTNSMYKSWILLRAFRMTGACSVRHDTFNCETWLLPTWIILRYAGWLIYIEFVSYIKSSWLVYRVRHIQLWDMTPSDLNNSKICGVTHMYRVRVLYKEFVTCI